MEAENEILTENQNAVPQVPSFDPLGRSEGSTEEDGKITFSEVSIEIGPDAANREIRPDAELVGAANIPADSVPEATSSDAESTDSEATANRQNDTADEAQSTNIFDIAEGLDPNFPQPSHPAHRHLSAVKQKNFEKPVSTSIVSDKKKFVFACIAAGIATLLFILQTVEAVNVFSLVGTVCHSMEELASVGGKLLLNIALAIPTSALLLIAEVTTVRLSLTAEREDVRLEKPFLALILLCLFYFVAVLTYYIIFFIRL